jgi:ribosomal protein S18 acetylase RimI-like enzyme
MARLTSSQLTSRRVDVEADATFLLELHGRINHQSDSDWFRGEEEAYIARWASSAQTKGFLQSLELSLADPRTLMEIWEVDGTPAAYLWATFIDVEDYDLCIAEVQEIGVMPQYRRQGIGRRMLAYIEQESPRRGAHALRVDAGAGNDEARQLYESAGFRPQSVTYEKLLDPAVEGLGGRPA